MLNLITDPWIPVALKSGKRQVIRPDQIAEAGVMSLAWERPDFNLACLELLIGLVYLAVPPANSRDWSKRRKGNAVELREQFAYLAPGFELNGESNKFMQDQEDLEADPNPVDMLFIDSAGASTIKHCADLMVKRERYESLSLPMAAMALFTFQSQAPAGGAGNRTSMRGGGPLITLVKPVENTDTPIWDVVWANVPDGKPVQPDDLNTVLPWMRPTVTSKKGEKVHPKTKSPIPAECFFGMPRRIRLDFSNDGALEVTGVRQRPSGTNYGLWVHPLSPYYQQKEGAEMLPAHPRPGASTYRNWEGVSLSRTDGLRHLADCIRTWRSRTNDEASLIVGGWAMDKMTPQDFQFSRQPLLSSDAEVEDFALSIVDASAAFALALIVAIQAVTNIRKTDASKIEAYREEFYLRSQRQFEEHIARLVNGEEWSKIAESWVGVTRRIAFNIFETLAMPGVSRRSIQEIEQVVRSHAQLRAAFLGYGPKTGKAAFEALDLELPKPRKKKDKST